MARTSWNKGLKGAQIAWNKGATKETNQSVAKTAAKLTGSKQPQEVIDKRRATKAKHDAELTPEQRHEKYARKMSPEHEANFLASHFRKHTPEENAKISKAQRGIPKTEKAKASYKIAREKYYSVEHPERSKKLSVALTAYWANLSEEEYRRVVGKQIGVKRNITDADRQRRRDLLIARNMDPIFIENNRKKLVGRIRTEEQRKRASITTANYVKNHPEVRARQSALINKLLEERRTGFAVSRQKNGIESYPEKKFREYLELIGCVKNKDFVQEHQVGRYSLDFALLNLKIDLEIDGKQHYTSGGVQHDIKRDAYLESLGWKIIRIPAKELNVILRGWWNLDTFQVTKEI